MSGKIVFLTFVTIVAARLWYVETFAVALPFWDQWDAEGDFLLRPWIQGTLRFQDLWQSHNEHRIFPTRILSLLIFIISGTWNNLVEARVNVMLAAVFPVGLAAFILKQKAFSGIRWLVLAVIIAQFSLPFSFENFLIGFQSQFYFLLIFTLAALLLAVLYPAKFWSYCIVLVICAWSVLTMASGLFTALAVASVLLYQMMLKRKLLRPQAVTLAVLLMIAAGGYLMIPKIIANQGYRAKNGSEFVNAMGVILSWPVTEHPWIAVVLWLPGVAGIIWLLAARRPSQVDLVMTGCLAWSLMQAVAIAYGRGHWLSEVSSRYTDLFSPGLIANAWFAARLTELLHDFRLVRWVPVSFFVTIMIGYVVRHDPDMQVMRRNYAHSLAQMRNVSRYLHTSDPAALKKPMYEIPYPHQDRLQKLLDDPTIRSIIPEIEMDRSGDISPSGGKTN